MQNPSFNDRLTILGICRDKVEGVDIAILANAMDAPETLFQPRRVPGHVIVDHQVAKLKVDAFAGGLGRYTNLRASPEYFLSPLAFVRIHAAMNFAGAIPPAFKMIANIAQGIPMLRENQELPSPVLQFQELSLAETLL